jgi:hypothetical protein
MSEVPMLGLTAEQQREAADFVWRELLSGRPEEEIRGDLGLNEEEYAGLRNLALDRAAEQVKGRPAELQFLDYMINQGRCVRELNEMVQALKTTTTDEDGHTLTKVNQAAAYVSAVRTKSEIFDRVVQWGKELGLLKVETGSSLIPGVNVKDLSSDELRSLIVREARNMDKLVNHFGEADIAEVNPGNLYEAPVPVKAHTRQTVHGGRRVLKGVK